MATTADRAAAVAAASSTNRRRSVDLSVASACSFAIIVVLLIAFSTRQQQPNLLPPHIEDTRDDVAPYRHHRRRRRLAAVPVSDQNPSSASSISSPVGSIGKVLSKATAQPSPNHNPTEDDRLRVLYIVTTLSEYDRGTRGTTRGADRLQNVVIPVIEDAVSSMVKRGWDVDLYLICGYEELSQERRRLVEDALPPGVGLEIWADAMPLFYSKSNANNPKASQSLDVASHGLSRQHRYVVRDKLLKYEFFAAFEDDMRITADHVVNYLEMAAGIESLRIQAENAPDGMVHVEGESNRDPSTRGKPMDKAQVGNDVVDDPLTAEYLKRVIPGFVRVEVLDSTTNQLLRGNNLDQPKYSSEVPIDKSAMIDPNYCCREAEPGRGRMMPYPSANDVVIWETNIGAAGVRRYPDPIGWAGAMPVEDRADVGSYWAGEGEVLQMSRPRRLDATLGQQAGWMATRSQIEYFHHEACPGGFLPPFDQAHWKGDSLQRHAVEFWSGGFQLFGQCFLNRILSMDPDRFSRQLLYHTANNKQSTLRGDKFVRAADFLGQLNTVKSRAQASLQAR